MAPATAPVSQSASRPSGHRASSGSPLGTSATAPSAGLHGRRESRPSSTVTRLVVLAVMRSREFRFPVRLQKISVRVSREFLSNLRNASETPLTQVSAKPESDETLCIFPADQRITPRDEFAPDSPHPKRPVAPRLPPPPLSLRNRRLSPLSIRRLGKTRDSAGSWASVFGQPKRRRAGGWLIAPTRSIVSAGNSDGSDCGESAVAGPPFQSLRRGRFVPATEWGACLFELESPNFFAALGICRSKSRRIESTPRRAFCPLTATAPRAERFFSSKK